MTQKRRDLEASKLQEEYDKKFRRYEGYIERLEAKAGQLLHVAEGICGIFSPPLYLLIPCLSRRFS